MRVWEKTPEHKKERKVRPGGPVPQGWPGGEGLRPAVGLVALLVVGLATRPRGREAAPEQWGRAQGCALFHPGRKRVTNSEESKM